MKPLYLLSIIYVVLIMSGCASTTVNPQTLASEHTQPTTVSKVHKDPISVSVITKQKPTHPYKVIGKARVSKFNLVGIKRQEATIRDIMRQLAASLNADAVIDVKNNEKDISATIIAYQDTIV